MTQRNGPEFGESGTTPIGQRPTTMDEKPTTEDTLRSHGQAGEYRTGQAVEKSGAYECGACGQTISLRQGDTFPKCPSCAVDRQWSIVREQAA